MIDGISVIVSSPTKPDGREIDIYKAEPKGTEKLTPCLFMLRLSVEDDN